MSNVDRHYLTHLRELMFTTNKFEGRNGRVSSIFGHQMRFDLAKEFPILLSKRVHFHSVLVELLWFLKGMSNTDYLHKHKVSIWDEWADEKGDLGPVYGVQWRNWIVPDEYSISSMPTTIDQIKNVIESIKNNPHGRRHVVSAWNPAVIDEMALPPCHCLFQFYVDRHKRLSCQLYQRSADWFLGVPFNIASYALLTILVARECGLTPGEFVHSFGDTHLYGNHSEAAIEQLSRYGIATDKANTARVVISDHAPGIFDLEPHHIELIGYDPLPTIKAPVSR